jgi:hypothetical protein
MNKYIRIVEREIAIIQGCIDQHKGCGVFHNNCIAWEHHLTAYQRILELLTLELERPKGKNPSHST